MKGARRGHFFPLRLYLLPVAPPQILIPALMVTAEKDRVLVPELSRHMEEWVRAWRCAGADRASQGRAWGPRGTTAAEDSAMFGPRPCLTRGFISNITVTSWEQQWLMLPLSCTDGGSFIHSLTHLSVHFTGFYCALKCVGPVLGTAVVKVNKTQVPPSGSALPLSESLAREGREEGMLGNEGFTEVLPIASGLDDQLRLAGQREHGAKDTGCREVRSLHAWKMAGASRG